MKKAVTSLLIGIIGLVGYTQTAEAHRVPGTGSSLSACGNATHFRDIPCSEVDRAITEAAREFGIDETRFRRVARCESGFNPFNSPGPFWGLLQHLKSEWSGRVTAFNRGYNPDVLGNPHSPFDNARVGAWMIRNGGWSPWPNC